MTEKLGGSSRRGVLDRLRLWNRLKGSVRSHASIIEVRSRRGRRGVVARFRFECETDNSRGSGGILEYCSVGGHGAGRKKFERKLSEGKRTKRRI